MAFQTLSAAAPVPPPPVPVPVPLPPVPVPVPVPLPVPPPPPAPPPLRLLLWLPPQEVKRTEPTKTRARIIIAEVSFFIWYLLLLFPFDEISSPPVTGSIAHAYVGIGG
ncbi:MAG: hypothetical protein E3J72_16745 [Planctomycetota bacterium]|nr:MAG: hypothetical protein E3J72_16745 [Planctomycetota bacterium]